VVHRVNGPRDFWLSANTAASLASKNIHTTVKIGIGIDLVQLSLFVGGSQDNTINSGIDFLSHDETLNPIGILPLLLLLIQQLGDDYCFFFIFFKPDPLWGGTISTCS
jgi:hypothetical protein